MPGGACARRSEEQSRPPEGAARRKMCAGEKKRRLKPRKAHFTDPMAPDIFAIRDFYAPIPRKPRNHGLFRRAKNAPDPKASLSARIFLIPGWQHNRSAIPVGLASQLSHLLPSFPRRGRLARFPLPLPAVASGLANVHPSQIIHGMSARRTRPRLPPLLQVVAPSRSAIVAHVCVPAREKHGRSRSLHARATLHLARQNTAITGSIHTGGGGRGGGFFRAALLPPRQRGAIQGAHHGVHLAPATASARPAAIRPIRSI